MFSREFIIIIIIIIHLRNPTLQTLASIEKCHEQCNNETRTSNEYETALKWKRSAKSVVRFVVDIGDWWRFCVSSSNCWLLEVSVCVSRSAWCFMEIRDCVSRCNWWLLETKGCVSRSNCCLLEIQCYVSRYNAMSADKMLCQQM